MGNQWGLESCFRHNKEYFFKELQQIKKLGFNGATIVDPGRFTLTLLQIKKGFEDSGLSLLQIRSDYYNIADPDAGKRQKAIERYKKRVEFALELEAEELVIYPGGQDMFFRNDEEKKKAARQNTECLKEIIKETQGTNLKISLENVRGGIEISPEHLKEILKKVKGTSLETRIKKKNIESEFRFGTNPSQLLEVISAVRGESSFKNIGICLNIRIDIPDPFNSGIDTKDIILEVEKYINSVRLQEKHPLLVGRGPSKWNQVMNVFEKISYSGPFILEVERWQEHAEALMDNIRYFDRLTFFKKRLTETR